MHEFNISDVVSSTGETGLVTDWFPGDEKFKARVRVSWHEGGSDFYDGGWYDPSVLTFVLADGSEDIVVGMGEGKYILR